MEENKELMNKDINTIKQNLYDLNLSQDLRVKLLNEQNSLILNNKLSTKISPNKSKIKYNNNNKKINF